MTEKKVFSIGFWGIPNLGDELICKVVSDYLLSKGWRSRFLLTNSRSVSERYLNLDDHARFVQGFWPTPEFSLNFQNQLSAVLESDFITIGGGGLIGDRYSIFSIPRYSIYALLCVLFSKSYVFIGLGVLKVQNRFLNSVARFVLSNSSYVYCRDQISLDRVLQYGVSPQFACKAPDLSFLYEENRLASDDAGKEAKKCGVEFSGGYILINLREDPAVSILSIKRLLLLVSQKWPGLGVVFLAAERGDTGYLESLVLGLTELNVKPQVLTPNSFKDAVDAIHSAVAVISVRLHVTALAVHLNKPLVPIIYEDKVNLFLEDAGFEQTKLNLSASGDDIYSVLERSLENNAASKNAVNARASEVREALDRAMNAALKPRLRSIRVKSIALFYLVLFVLFSLAWTPLALLKRMLVGRG